MLTLDGLTEPAPEAVIQALEEELAEAERAMGAYWKDERNRPPQHLLSRRLTREQRSAELAGCDQSAFNAMFRDTVEVRFFTAQRRLLLAQHGFDDCPIPCHVAYESPDERFGALLSIEFIDRLSCVDPRRQYDALYAGDGGLTEIWWAFHAPKQGVKRWRAKREAEGNPWKPNAELSNWPAPVTRKELKQVRAILYGDRKGSERRYLTPRESQEAYRAVLAEINGEPPHAISMLMKLDADNLTPIQALSTLKHLQDVARRRDSGPRLFDGP
ncbi:hypothetical protein QE369_004224 [Agrobacterium larrymoorei]|uniref:Uncharacterized protein n=1 Tax=Agrobacterium larrymoorei TaxID=160699 RepID=A0AAJ2BFH9_9HYPH|nr:hypothetical protein [Agrobacterium larrymoorei]MDR6104027.1 hypothetical protein [Agrobacterium larrymoorei]